MVNDMGNPVEVTDSTKVTGAEELCPPLAISNSSCRVTSKMNVPKTAGKSSNERVPSCDTVGGFEEVA